MMKSKIEFFQEIKEKLKDDSEIVEFCNNEINRLQEKRKEKERIKRALAIEKESFLSIVYGCLSDDEWKTIEQLKQSDEDLRFLSFQKMGSILDMLYKRDLIERRERENYKSHATYKRK